MNILKQFFYFLFFKKSIILGSQYSCEALTFSHLLKINILNETGNLRENLFDVQKYSLLLKYTVCQNKYQENRLYKCKTSVRH